METEGDTSISFLAFIGTLGLQQNSVINIEMGGDVLLCFACMLIFESITVPRFVLSCIIMHPRRESLPFYKNDSFWEGIIVLLMNPNQYFAANFNYFFSI